MPLTSVLIANRGEIACRIIRTARSQGLRTISVYSEADAQAPHVALADEAVLIGPGPVAESYLCADKIVTAAKTVSADAIHPGYGFLSENADFARKVAAAGLIFIGPPAEAIEVMGNKAAAKRTMIAANIPCVPGYQGEDQSDSVLIAKAHEIGLPVMVKAAAGGGGRGMRLVGSDDQLAESISLARKEAKNAFGSDELILERAITAPRHVEVQIFADAFGNCIHLGERDCSVQRRHQKVVEEAPCPVMTPELRSKMGQAAVNAARAVNYCGAGTVEFLLDSDGSFYFLEMNTRLQVEHPVTELVSGLDLVALQLAIADGARLPISQDDVQLNGHAIEARLYAEDPANEYLPATGRIDLWRPATGDGVRIDAGVVTGQHVTPYYDAMLGKIIAHGETRDTARARLMRAVEDTVVLGIKTNSAFLRDVLSHPAFVAGKATTAFLTTAYPDGYADRKTSAKDIALAAALLGRHAQRAAFDAAGYLSKNLLGWTSAPMQPAQMKLAHGESEFTLLLGCARDAWQVHIENRVIDVLLEENTSECARAKIDGVTVEYTAVLNSDRADIAIGARRMRFERVAPGSEHNSAHNDGVLVAPMPGLLREILVKIGQTIQKGDTLAILEAMKMQHQIAAPFDGQVTVIHGSAGQQVTAGKAIIEIQETAS